MKNKQLIIMGVILLSLFIVPIVYFVFFDKSNKTPSTEKETYTQQQASIEPFDEKLYYTLTSEEYDGFINLLTDYFNTSGKGISSVNINSVNKSDSSQDISISATRNDNGEKLDIKIIYTETEVIMTINNGQYKSRLL